MNDLAEAEHLILLEIDRLNPDIQGRRSAGESLLEAVAKLRDAQDKSVTVSKGPRGLFITSAGVFARVVVNPKNGHLDVSVGEGPNVVPETIKGLVFDLRSKEWLGEARDTFRLADGNTPATKRSAVAIVVEAALNKIRKFIEEKR